MFADLHRSFSVGVLTTASLFPSDLPASSAQEPAPAVAQARAEVTREQAELKDVARILNHHIESWVSLPTALQAQSLKSFELSPALAADLRLESTGSVFLPNGCFLVKGSYAFVDPANWTGDSIQKLWVERLQPHVDRNFSTLADEGKLLRSGATSAELERVWV